MGFFKKKSKSVTFADEDKDKAGLRGDVDTTVPAAATFEDSYDDTSDFFEHEDGDGDEVCGVPPVAPPVALKNFKVSNNDRLRALNGGHTREQELLPPEERLEFVSAFDQQAPYDYCMCFPYEEVDEEPEPLPWYKKLMGAAAKQEKKLNISNERGRIIRKLRLVGLDVKKTISRDEDEILLKVRCPYNRQVFFAEKMGLRCRLKDVHGGGYVEFKKDMKEKFVSAQSFRSSAETPEPGTTADEGDRFTFTSAERQMIIHHLITSRPRDGGAFLDLLKLTYDGSVMSQSFAIHDPSKKKELLEEWASPKNMFKRQPLSKVLQYYGSEVALYYAFLGKYTLWLVVPSIIGLFAFIMQVTTGFDSPAVPAYAVFIAVWSTAFLEAWKRHEATLAFLWGTEGFEESEGTRPQFKGEERLGFYDGNIFVPLDQPPVSAMRRLSKAVQSSPAVMRRLMGNKEAAMQTAQQPGMNPVTMKAAKKKRAKTMDPVKEAKLLALAQRVALAKGDQPLVTDIFFPARRRTIRYVVVWAVILLFSLTVVTAMTTVLLTKSILSDNVGGPAFLSNASAGILLAITIGVFGFIFDILAVYMVSFENCRTETQYIDSLIGKSALFAFVNNYFSLFFIAFFKLSGVTIAGATAECDAGDCITELSATLFSMMVFSQISGQIQEVLIPMLVSKVSIHMETIKMKMNGQTVRPLTSVELESKLAPLEGSYDDMSELVKQFGLIVLFSAAFPLAPLTALINNLVEIRTDSIKMLSTMQRPLARTAEDIGSWQSVLDVFATLGVVTNCALVGFTSSQLKNFGLSTLEIVATVVIVEHVLLAAKFSLAAVVPDVPAWVIEAKARQEFQTNAVMEESGSEDDLALHIEDWDVSSGVDSDVFEEDSDLEIWRRAKESMQLPPGANSAALALSAPGAFGAAGTEMSIVAGKQSRV